MKTWLTSLAALVVGLAAAPAAWAQGCILCRNTAAAGAADAARTFDIAILVLLVPTILIFVGVLAFAFRYRNRSRADDPGLYPDPLDDPSFTRSLRGVERRGTRL